MCDHIMERATLALAAQGEYHVRWVDDSDMERSGIVRHVDWESGEVRVTESRSWLELFLDLNSVLAMLRDHNMIIVGEDGHSLRVGLTR